MEKVMYGLKLKNKDRLLQYMENSNGEAINCNDTEVELVDSEYETDWFVDSFEKAKLVKYNSIEWYNSDFERPINPFNSDDLEIVKVVMKTEVVNEPETFEIKPINVPHNGIKIVLTDPTKIQKDMLGCYTVHYDKQLLEANRFIAEDYNEEYYLVVKAEAKIKKRYNSNSLDSKFRYVLKKDWEKV